MDNVDRSICSIVQRDAKASCADIAESVGVSVSTANERVRRLAASGVIREWRGVLEPRCVGASLCAFVLIDMTYSGEREADEILAGRPEVMEIHHVTGAHSYLCKIRVADADALQRFLQEIVKPLPAVHRTETLIALSTLKETTEVLIGGAGKDA